ncbi:branched-chain amino acid ABC transporter ATP-binding protein/permease [Acidisoma sp. C75]
MDTTTAPPDAKPGHENTNALHTVEAPPGKWRWLAAPFDKQRNRVAAICALALFAVLFPVITGDQANIDSAANAAAYAALALGLNVVVGFCGLLDLGYAAFFAIGAYAYGVLTSWQLTPAWSGFWMPFQALGLVHKIVQNGQALVHFTVSFWIMLPLSGVIAAFFGVLFGAPTLRLRGDYLAIVTLGFGEIVPIVARNWTGLTNGAAGLNGIAAPTVFSYHFGINATPYYYVGIGLVAFLIFASTRLRESRIGRAWMAIRDDEIAASAMGIDLTRFKLLAFGMGAGFAGMAGTFYVAKLQTATPDMFGFPVSVMILVMVVLGGLGSVWGVVLGAVALQLLQSWFLGDLTQWVNALGDAVGSNWMSSVDLTQASELIFGIILVLMMLYRREGLIPANRRQRALSFEQQHATVQTRIRAEDVRLSALGTVPHQARPGDVPMLEIRDLTVRFGGLVALNKVNITVPQGSVVAVIGPNGSGKSTLFNTITGLTRAGEGSILFNGRDILGLPPHEILKAGIARTFQNIRLFGTLTVAENIMVGQHARLKAGPLSAVFRSPNSLPEEKAARAWIVEIAQVFGNRLVPRLTQTVVGLSYANRRRVEISRALASKPKLLLLDEPTAGMNTSESLELAEQIKGLHALGLTVLIIEHKLDVVTRIADKVIVLDHGEKLTEGLPDEVRRNEQVLEAYLGRGAAAHA